MGRRSLALVTLLALLGAPALVHAQGFEYGSPGTRALGRGGAFAARADDPMALGYNPAALAFLPGYQLMAGSHLAFYDACVQRSGGYNDSDVSTLGGVYDSRFGYPDTSDPSNWVNQPFPMVCRNGYPGPSPQLVFTGHPLPGFGFGVGILAPAGVGNATWGNPDGTVDVNGTTLPSPTRYALVKQDLLLFHPTIGVGWSPVDWISFGVSLQWGIAIVNFVNHANSSPPSGMNTAISEDPAADVRTDLSVTDLFVPAIIASVHVVPIDQLDIVATARFSDGIDADGTLAVTTGTFGTGQAGSLSPTTTTVPGTHLHAGQPWTFTLAARYADRVRTRYRDPDEAGRVTGRVEDQMQNETWDIELDATYQLNSQVTDFVVTPGPSSGAVLCESSTCLSPIPLPTKIPIPHGWGDQLAVRVGGDWNILPGQLAIRAGANFLTSGLNSQYQIQDFLPLMSLGLSLGMTVRIDRFDISVAYSHIFQFSETITNGNYRLAGPLGNQGMASSSGMMCSNDYDSSNPVSSRGCYPQGYGPIVNNGTYTGELNVASLQVRYHFQ